MRPDIRNSEKVAMVMKLALSIGLSMSFPGQEGTGASPAVAPRPLLVTVDDLPIASTTLHRDPADRRRLTEKLLDVLEDHDIRAVGFVTWGNVLGPGDLDLLRMWLRAGHELGNHSHAHLDLTTTDTATYLADVERGRVALSDFLEAEGRTLRFFRFPFLREGDTGEKLDAVRAWLERTGQRNVPATIDTQDWFYEKPWVEASRGHDRRALERVRLDYLAALRTGVRHHEHEGDRLQDRIRDGTRRGPLPQVLLLHANAVGAANWKGLFEWLVETGHRFATADEVLADPVFQEPHRFVAVAGTSLWERLAHERHVQSVREEIEGLLRSQAEAWNRGDLEAFCSVYAEDATFLAPSGKVEGRAAVLERYRARYPDRAAMGTLALEVLELRPLWGMEATVLGDAEPGEIHGATVVARWTLTYPDKDPAAGHTLLVFAGGPAGWKILQDASM